MSRIKLPVILIAFALIAVCAAANTMSTVNYEITWDVVDSGGGSASTASYEAYLASAGQPAAGFAQTANYEILAGYVQLETGGGPTPTMTATPGPLTQNLCETDTVNQHIINSLSRKISYRFTAPHAMTVSKIHIAGLNGGTSEFTVGIQADSGTGVPNGVYLFNSTSTAMASYWNTFDVPDTAIAAGNVYHIVAQPNVITGQYNFASTGPNHRIFPEDQLYDASADVATYNGVSWTVENKMPVFVLEDAGGFHFGNPYNGGNFLSARVHANATTYTTDDRVVGQQIQALTGNKTVNRLSVRLLKSGAVTSDLRYRIENVTDAQVMADGVLCTAALAAASHSWQTVTFSDITLQTGKQYRVLMYCAGDDTSATAYYEINMNSDYDVLNNTMFYDRTYAGTDQIKVVSFNGMASYSVYPYDDIVFRLDYVLMPTPTPTWTATAAATAVPVLLSNRFVVDGNSWFTIDDNTKKTSYRFKAPGPLTVDKIHIRVENTSGGPSFTAGLQGNTAGTDVPDGVYLASVSQALITGTNIFDIADFTLTGGETYHVVIQGDALSLQSAGISLMFGTSGMVPATQDPDPMFRRLTYNGTWSLQSGAGPFILEEAGGKHFGNPYHTVQGAAIHGQDTAGDTGDDAVSAMRINWAAGVTQVAGVSAHVKKTGSPTSDLMYLIYNITDKVTMTAGTLAAGTDLSTAYAWKAAYFAPVTLETSKEYRVMFYADGAGTGTTSGNYYSINGYYHTFGTAFNSTTYAGVSQYREQSFTGPSGLSASLNGDFNFELIPAGGASTPTYTPTYTATPGGAATPVLDWWEEFLLPAEAPAATGANDSTGVAPFIPFNSAGGGYAATGADRDNYRFTVPNSLNNPGHDILRVRVYVPGSELQYAINLYESDGGGGWNSVSHSCMNNDGNTNTAYYDVSSRSLQDWDFIAEIFPEDGRTAGKFYVLTVDLVDSGTITGTLSLVGAEASGASNVQVSAYRYVPDKNETAAIAHASTDASGNYSLKVPAGVEIEKLAAERSWYNGCPADWAYGKTVFNFSPFLTVGAGGTSGGNDFEVFREGVLSGNINFSGISPRDMEINIEDNYHTYYIDGLYNTRGAYAMHNLPPGNYFVTCRPSAGYGSGAAVSFCANVLVRDGFETKLDFNISGGATLTGTISPPPFEETEIQLMGPGSSFIGRDPVREYYRTRTATNTYTIQNVPPGNYDLKAGGGGISMWLPKKNITVTAPSTVINFSDPLPVTFIAGTVTDMTGTFDFSNDMFMVYAMPKGTQSIIDDSARGYGGPVIGTGSSGAYTVMLPTVYAQYDLVLMHSPQGYDGPGTFVDRRYDIPQAVTNCDFTINGGASVSGNIFYSGKSVGYYNASEVIVEVLKDVSGVYKYYDLAFTKTGEYGTGKYMAAGNLLLKTASQYFNPATRGEVLGAADITGADFIMSLNASKDKFMPYSGYLNPPHKGTLASGSDLLFVTVDDRPLGAGLTSVSVLSDGVPVENLQQVWSQDTAKRYSFQLPAAQRGQGSTRYISVTGTDAAGNVYSSGATWEVRIALPAPVCNTYGNTAIGGTPYTLPGPGYILGNKVAMSAGTLSAAHVYAGAAGGYVQAAVYSDSTGRPGLLLAQGISRPAQAGWNKVDFAPYEVAAAGNYWILFNFSTAVNSPAYDMGAPGEGYYYWYGAFPFLPSSLSASGTIDNRKWSVYTETCNDPAQIYNLSKSVMPVNAAPGETVLYSIDYSYKGGNMVITDAVPQYMTLLGVGNAGTAGCSNPGCGLTWTLGTSSVKKSGSVSFKARLFNDMAAGTVITNRAHAVITENTAGIDSNITELPVDGVAVSKSQSLSTVFAGSTITYTLDWGVKGQAFKEIEDFESITAGSYTSPVPPPGWKFSPDGSYYGTWTILDDGSGNQVMRGSSVSSSWPQLLLEDGSALNDSDQFCEGTIMSDLMIEPNSELGADALVVIRSNGQTLTNNYSYGFVVSIDNAPVNYYTYQKCSAGMCSWYSAVTFTAQPAVPNTWYKVKIKADVTGNDYVFKGKLWKKGEPEPELFLYNWTDVGAVVNANLRCDGLGTYTDWRPGVGQQTSSNCRDYYDNFLVLKDRKVKNGRLYDTVPACVNYMYGDAADGLHTNPVLSGGMVYWDIPGPASDVTATRHWVGQVTAECVIQNKAALIYEGLNAPVFSNEVVAAGPSPTVTQTVTATATLTVSASITATVTGTATGTITGTASATVTATVTETVTQSATASLTATVTGTSSMTVTATVTQTATASITTSATSTITETTSMTATATTTETTTASITATVTGTATGTVSGTVTASVTPTSTSSVSPTSTATVSESATGTVSATTTATATQTITLTATPTVTMTSSGTGTNTQTVTPSVTPSATRTVTETVSGTASPTVTKTITTTSTETMTETVTPTITQTSSDTHTPTDTATDTNTPTETYTVTDTPTQTFTQTFTVTNTFTDTATSTSTYTGTNTPTDTGTATFTHTSTNSPTATATFTPTSTPTATQTYTITGTYTYTSTLTSTETETYTLTPSQTFTITNTWTITDTPTITHTFTVTYTPTQTVTPNIAVALDRNYVEPLKGGLVTIMVKAGRPGERIEIKIFNLNGELIRRLERTATDNSWQNLEWDCKNSSGNYAGRGLYFIHIRTEAGAEIRRIFVVK